MLFKSPVCTMMAAVKQLITRSLPVVVVVGSTGTGKSKLAIQIAKAFNGEIISADSMQVYKGLDIVTNKVSTEEQAESPHHLINYVSALHTQYTVVDYQKAALPIIDGLLDHTKLPVIVGGTNYYIESLLWNYLLPNPQDGSPMQKRSRTEVTSSSIETELVNRSVVETEIPDDQSDIQNESILYSDGHSQDESEKGDSAPSPSFIDRLKQVDSATLYLRLSQVDPLRARRIHPNNRRKVIRALEVYEQHGVAASELYQDQHGAELEQAISGPLRYQNVCVLWIQCQQDVLDKRLDDRVDGMMSRGLIQELEDFHHCYNKDRLTNHSDVDYQLGIFQNIGFKEFHNYLILPEEEKSTKQGRQLLKEGVDEMKRITRKYAKKQVRWIRNRFLKRPGPDACPVYALDGTDVTQWEEKVRSPALKIVSSVIEGRIPSQEPLPLEAQGKNPAVHNVCEACGGKVFLTLSDWTRHIESKRHRNTVMKKRREELGLSNADRLRDHMEKTSSVT